MCLQRKRTGEYEVFRVTGPRVSHPWIVGFSAQDSLACDSTHHSCAEELCWRLIVRSPFWAKHHVVMQYMAAGPKCPLPPLPPQPDPPPAEDSMAGGGQGGPGRIDKQGRIDDINAAAMLQGTSHCSCLEHCFSLVVTVVDVLFVFADSRHRDRQRSTLPVGAVEACLL